MHERINAIISAIRGHLGTGDRPLGVKDFYRICQIDNIIVEEVSSARSFILKPQAAGGGATVIGLSRQAKGRDRCFQMFHELGHYFCDHARCGPEEEAEADLFATLATGHSIAKPKP